MSRSIRVARPEPPAPRSAPLALERVVTAFAALALVVGVFVPPSAFAATRNWSLTRTPATVTGGGPASVQITATNTGDDGGSEAIGCVILVIPASAFAVTEVAIDPVGAGRNWSASVSGDGTWWYATLVAGNRLHSVESVVATVTFMDTGVDGTFSWTGNAYNNADCTDDFQMPRTIAVTIDAAVVDTAPLAQPDSYITGRNAPLTVGAPGVLINDTDADGDALTAIQTSDPANGDVAWGGDGSFTYTPDPGFVGPDSFTYRAHDGTWPSADVTITVDVTNALPVAVDDVYSISWAQPLIVPSPGILGNDTDLDGDPLVAGVVSGPSNGTLSPNADGSFTYLPNVLFVGTDSFVYAASDGVASAQATVFINVANAAPAASSDGPYVGSEDTALVVPAPGVLANDDDGDGDALAATLVADATNGTVTLQPDGSFRYLPDANFNGADSFTYRASDGRDTSPITSVSITVAPLDDAPIASPETYGTAEDTALIVPAPGVLSNDTEPDGETVTAAVVSLPANGHIDLDPDGSLAYTPDRDFSGSDSFTYVVDDGRSTDSATVTVTVSAVNDAPVARADSAITPSDTPVLVPVLANDTDIDGDLLTLASVGPPSIGSASVQGNRVRYTPPTGFSGQASIVYRVSDGAATASATITVTVAPPPVMPPPTPTLEPTATPDPVGTPSPPAAEPVPPGRLDAEPSASPSPEATKAPQSPSPSISPAASARPPEARPGPEHGDPDGGLVPLASPELTAAFGPTEGLFDFAGMFGGLGGGFAWAMPAAMLGVPGLLFMLAVAAQLFGAAAWIPAIRRMLAGVGVRRRHALIRTRHARRATP